MKTRDDPEPENQMVADGDEDVVAKLYDTYVYRGEYTCSLLLFWLSAKIQFYGTLI